MEVIGWGWCDEDMEKMGRDQVVLISFIVASLFSSQISFLLCGGVVWCDVVND